MLFVFSNFGTKWYKNIFVLSSLLSVLTGKKYSLMLSNIKLITKDERKLSYWVGVRKWLTQTTIVLKFLLQYDV